MWQINKIPKIPDGYKLMDHPRTLHRGGGTGLLFRDTLTVKIVDAGEMNG